MALPPPASSNADTYWMRVFATLNEPQRRRLAAAQALSLGRGGLQHVCQLTGLSPAVVIKGKRELLSNEPLLSDRQRRVGAGRKPLTTSDPAALQALQRLVDDTTAGDPTGSLRWTHKSTRTLAEEMTRHGHPVSHTTVAALLKELGYSLQVNAKNKEGRSPVERDQQFRHINAQVRAFQEAGNPVLSIDTKKKEKVGLFKNPGLAWRPKGTPVEVNTYDFPDLGKGTAIPYGVYDVRRNEGFVNVGMNHDTSEFAVEGLRWWWQQYGRRRYPHATGLLLCADGGGSNGSRNRGWKLHLQELASLIGKRITVCHYPPGASKWNRIEHRMFSQISLNWQGIPLESYETVVNLIAGTKTRTGLKVRARLDNGVYAKG
ncbi:Transposase, Rhodopirellula-type, partial [mine drainage metagenome]